MVGALVVDVVRIVRFGRMAAGRMPSADAEVMGACALIGTLSAAGPVGAEGT